MAADDRADAEIAKLKDKFEAKIAKLRTQIDVAEDRADVLEAERSGKRNEEVLSTVGSVLRRAVRRSPIARWCLRSDWVAPPVVEDERPLPVSASTQRRTR